MIRRDFLLPFFWRVAAACSLLASGMICLWLYPRYLTPTAFGVVVVALTILSYLPLLDGGFKLTINRAALSESSPEKRKPLLQFYQTLHFYITGAALIVGLICMAAYWALPVTRQSGQPPTFFVTLAVIGALTVGSGLQAGLLIGLRAQEQTFVLTALNAWLNAGVLWMALRAGLDIWAFPMSMLTTLLVTYALAIWLIARREPSFKFFEWRPGPDFWDWLGRLRGSAWACFRSQVVTVLLYTVDLLFVLLLCGPNETAFYAVLSRMFGMLRSLLHSSGEVAWPIIAQRGMSDQSFRKVLRRGNAWLYGTVAGTLCVTLIPFCRWYVGEAWVPSPLVVYLVAARFVVTGLATPAAYVLYGLGEFQVLTRCLERELIAACGLAVVLGLWFKLPGVAWAFLLATVFGTFYPMIRAYAQRAGESPAAVLGQMWWRTAVGFVYSAFWAWCLLNYFPAGLSTTIPAAVGLLSGLMLAVVISALRMNKPATLLQTRGGFVQLLKSI